jgi:hypothetical protein
MSSNPSNHNELRSMSPDLSQGTGALYSLARFGSIPNPRIQQAVRLTSTTIWEFCQKCWKFTKLILCEEENDDKNILYCHLCKHKSDLGKYDKKLLGFEIPQSDGNSQNEEIKEDLDLMEEDLKILNEAILCQICHSTMNLATSLTSSCCAQTWCFDCIIKSLKYNSACPNCKKLITKPMLSKNRGMNNMYDTIKKFRCICGYPKCIEHRKTAEMY